jgi:uncharacterized membrane protein YkvA (DUF1232 family)
MPDSLSAPLRDFFRHLLGAQQPGSPSQHVARGAECVSAGDLAGLHGLLPDVMIKAALITGSKRLRRRVELLAAFMLESPPATNSPAHREIAFVLFYFLKGQDLIPDSVPEIGLLDDALLVDAALQRNRLALQSHRADRGQPWPDQL